MVEEFEPKQFGKYLLLEKIAVGGMAEIYKAKTYGVDGFEKELGYFSLRELESARGPLGLPIERDL